MKPPEPSGLLKEILAGDELADFRQRSLEQGLNALRKQQQRRLVVRIGTVLMLPLVFTLAFLSRRTPETSHQQFAATANPTAAALFTPPTSDRDTKFITDEELFALFPHRPMALVGRPGQQRLVFLDQPARSRPH